MKDQGVKYKGENEFFCGKKRFMKSPEQRALRKINNDEEKTTNRRGSPKKCRTGGE